MNYESASYILWTYQCRAGVRKSFLQAVSLALSSAIVLCVYSAGWRLAAYVVCKDRATIGGVFRYKKQIKCEPEQH